MSQETIQYRQKRVKPNPTQLQKIRKQLDGLNGLSSNKKIDYVFDGINTWEQGYNLATITLAFYPDCTELLDGHEYPRRDAMYDMKVKLRQFRESTQCERLVIYPSRGPSGKEEWRYFNMQQIDEFSLINKMDLVVINALKKWIKRITTVLNENPEYRNEEHKKDVAEIRYELMLRRRLLRQLEKKKIANVTVSEQQYKEGEEQNDENNEG